MEQNNNGFNVSLQNIDEANAKLVKLLAEARSTPKDKFPALMNKIIEEIVMNAGFIAVVRKAADPTKLEYALIEDGKGTKFYPCFTSMSEYQKWTQMAQQKPDIKVVGFDSYAHMVVDNNGAAGFVINPFGANLIVPKEACADWRTKKQHRLYGYAETRLDENAQIEFSDYEKMPEKLANALVSAAKADGRINALWLRSMTAGGVPSNGVICEFSGDREAASKALGEAAKPFMGGLDLNIFNAADPIGKRATEGAEPIFRK